MVLYRSPESRIYADKIGSWVGLRITLFLGLIQNGFQQIQLGLFSLWLCSTPQISQKQSMLYLAIFRRTYSPET